MRDVQTAVVWLVIGAVGVGGFLEYTKEKSNSVHAVSSSVVPDLNTKMASALSHRTLADHEILFKIFSGLSEYVSNANRLNTTVDCYKAVDEVMVVYDVKGKYKEIADIIDGQLSPIKTPAKLVDKKSDVIRLFSELAEAVKYSADNLPKTK